MTPAGSCIDNREYIRAFNMKTSQRRVPVSGSIDLTHRCNLRCVHCYLGAHDVRLKRRDRELAGERILSILDEIRDAGCLFLLLTGGEPLLREDFPEIYTRAKESGFLVTVFTNGTLITENIIDLFSDLPPYCVEISLYGSTPEIYERVTGVKGSYKRCIKGIRKLAERKINVRLKTILMTLNSHDLFSIEEVARAMGVKFRFDAAIFPCIDGDKSALDLRVPPRDAIEKEFSDPERLRLWERYFEDVRDQAPTDDLYTCGAGLTGFHIDPYGSLLPCLMSRDINFDLVKGNFLMGWENISSRVRDLKAGKSFRCNSCEKRFLCGFCPPFFEQENGSTAIRSEYLCEMGHHRYRVLKKKDVRRSSDAA
jgi:radical SAM protein with 4Fe4S-binding SPASM domain